jgi:hypothetical protein
VVLGRTQICGRTKSFRRTNEILNPVEVEGAVEGWDHGPEEGCHHDSVDGEEDLDSLELQEDLDLL